MTFQINYVHEASNREYAVVKLDEKKLSEALVSAGLAKPKSGPPRKDGKQHPYVWFFLFPFLFLLASLFIECLWNFTSLCIE